MPADRSLGVVTRRGVLLAAASAALTCATPLVARAAREARERVREHAAATRSNVVMLRDGEMVAEAGAIVRKLPVYSVRKSLLSALFGWAVDANLIRLDATLDDLGIDDVPPVLTPAERRASIRDLLMARSGVYHPAAYETRDMRVRRPARGAHPPGTFWFYNNWDFNALGTIYERATHEDIFSSFERRIARPIGLRDFTLADCAYVREPLSRHPAYTFRLSTRDLARFGELMRWTGSWEGTAVVPAAWIAEAARMASRTDRGPLGYGYMWWTIPSDIEGGGLLASGSGGQLLAVLPTARLVLAQLRPVDAAHGHTRTFLELLRELARS